LYIHTCYLFGTFPDIYVYTNVREYIINNVRYRVSVRTC